jgi:hypothetical protein
MQSTPTTLSLPGLIFMLFELFKLSLLLLEPDGIVIIVLSFVLVVVVGDAEEIVLSLWW